MARLDDRLDRTRQSRGGLVFVCGEPGIGKSMLVEHAAERAQAADLTVMWGRCWEAGGSPPYWAWIQVVRELVDARPEVLRQPVARLSCVAEIVPELRELVPDLPPAPALEPEQARFRIMDGVSSMLLDAARSAPSLVVIEDAHQLDSASALLLDFIGPRASKSPLLVVATTREEELNRADPHLPLAQLIQRSERLTLSRWSRSEVQAFLAQNPRASPVAASTIYSVTEGNPLFVAEAAHLMEQRPELAEGGLSFPLSQGLRSILDQRTRGCRPEVLDLLRVASVMGRDFHVERLARLIGGEVDQAGLQEAVREGVLEASGPGRFRYRHILVRDVLHDGLAVDRRQALHLAMARMLEAEGSSEWSALALHYHASGPEHWERAHGAAWRAAEASLSQFAFTEAVRYAAQAVAALDRPEGPRELRCQALLLLARARILAGLPEEGRASCLQAARLAREMERWDLLATAALEYGGVFVIASVDPQLVSLLEQSLRRLGPEAEALKARVLARYAAALQPAPDPEFPIQMARDAVEMARRTGDPPILLATLRSAVSAMMDLAPPSERRALNEEHIRLATELEQPVEAHRGHLRRCMDCLDLGAWGELRQSIAAAERYAALLDHPAYQWSTEALRSMMATLEGRFATAEAHAAVAQRLAELARASQAQVTLQLQRFFHQRAMGRDEAALDHLADALAGSDGAPFTRMLVEMLEVSARWRAGQPVSPLAHRWLRATLELGDGLLLVTMAEICVAHRDPRAADLLPGFRRREGLFAGTGLMGMSCDGPLARGEALVLDLLDRWPEAEARFEDALRECEARDAWPHWIRTVLDVERARRRRGLDRVESRLAAAAERARSLGMAFPGFEIESVAPTADALPRLVREGEGWRLDGHGASIRLDDRKGLRLLALLVEHPARPFHVLDLDGEGGGAPRDIGDAGEHLDDTAKANYRRRMVELQQELDEAETWSDLGRVERLQEELEQLQRELSRAVGLSGRSRRAGSAAERARVNVQRRLRDAIRRITAQSETLGRHFERSVKTGLHCLYDP
jgi:hypothetical protein